MESEVIESASHGWLWRMETRITRWLARYGLILLRISLGIVFFWFGVLKLFPGMSPAEQLAADTLESLMLHLVPGMAAVRVLGAWECAIGLGLLFNRNIRLTLILLLLQMLGTLSPLLLFPGKTFTIFPYCPTLEGQYIIKNLVLVSAGLVLAGNLDVRRKRRMRHAERPAPQTGG